MGQVVQYIRPFGAGFGVAALELTCNMEKGWDEIFACFDSLCLSQQSFNHVGMDLPVCTKRQIKSVLLKNSTGVETRTEQV